MRCLTLLSGVLVAVALLSAAGCAEPQDTTPVTKPSIRRMMGPKGQRVGDEGAKKAPGGKAQKP